MSVVSADRFNGGDSDDEIPRTETRAKEQKKVFSRIKLLILKGKVQLRMDWPRYGGY